MTLIRREFLQGAGLVVTLGLISPSGLRAADGNAWQGLRESILAGREPVEGGITLDLPDMAENGAQVPLGVHVDSPMTPAEHVEAIHVIATRNPAPEIGTFRLSPHLARAEVFTRIRVGGVQDILVLAEMSDGRVLQQAARVSVTVGGCAT